MSLQGQVLEAQKKFVKIPKDAKASIDKGYIPNASGDFAFGQSKSRFDVPDVGVINARKIADELGPSKEKKKSLLEVTYGKTKAKELEARKLQTSKKIADKRKIISGEDDEMVPSRRSGRNRIISEPEFDLPDGSNLTFAERKLLSYNMPPDFVSAYDNIITAVKSAKDYQESRIVDFFKNTIVPHRHNLKEFLPMEEGSQEKQLTQKLLEASKQDVEIMFNMYSLANHIGNRKNAQDLWDMDTGEQLFMFMDQMKDQLSNKLEGRQQLFDLASVMTNLERQPINSEAGMHTIQLLAKTALLDLPSTTNIEEATLMQQQVEEDIQQVQQDTVIQNISTTSEMLDILNRELEFTLGEYINPETRFPSVQKDVYLPSAQFPQQQKTTEVIPPQVSQEMKEPVEYINTSSQPRVQSDVWQPVDETNVVSVLPNRMRGAVNFEKIMINASDRADFNEVAMYAFNNQLSTATRGIFEAVIQTAENVSNNTKVDMNKDTLMGEDRIVQTKNKSLHGLSAQQPTSIHSVMGTIVQARLGDEQGEQRQKTAQTLLDYIAKTPLQMSKVNLPRNIPTIRDIVKADDTTLYKRLQTYADVNRLKVRRKGATLTDVEDEYAKNKEILQDKNAIHFYNLYNAVLESAPTNLQEEQKKATLSSFQPANKFTLTTNENVENNAWIKAWNMDQSVVEMKALNEKIKDEDKKFNDDNPNHKQMGINSEAAFDLYRKYVTAKHNDQLLDKELDDVSRHQLVVGSQTNDILLQQNEDYKTTSHYLASQQKLNIARDYYNSTDPRVTSGGLLLRPERFDSNGTYIPKGIEKLVSQGRYNTMLSPYAMDTYFPRSSNSHYNLFRPYFSRLKQISLALGAKTDSTFVSQIQENASSNIEVDEFRYGNLFTGGMDFLEKFVRAGKSFQDEFEDPLLSSDENRIMMLPPLGARPVMLAAEEVAAYKSEVPIKLAAGRYSDFIGNPDSDNKYATDLKLAWESTYFPLNNILHGALASGVLFDAAFEDTTIAPTFFEGDHMMFKDNLKKGGFFIVSGEQFDKQAEGIVSVNQLKAFQVRLRSLKAAYDTRDKKVTARDVQAGMRAAAGWTLYDALTGDYQSDQYTPEQISEGHHTHANNIRRAMIISDIGENQLTPGQAQWRENNILAMPGGGGLLRTYIDLISRGLAEDIVSMPANKDWHRSISKRVDPQYFQRNRVPMSPEVAFAFGHVALLTKFEQFSKSAYMAEFDDDQFESEMPIDFTYNANEAGGLKDKSKFLNPKYSKLPGQKRAEDDSIPNRPMFQIFPFLRAVASVGTNEQNDEIKEIFYNQSTYANEGQKNVKIKSAKAAFENAGKEIAGYREALSRPEKPKVFNQGVVSDKSLTHDELNRRIADLEFQQREFMEKGGVAGMEERLAKKRDNLKDFAKKNAAREHSSLVRKLFDEPVRRVAMSYSKKVKEELADVNVLKQYENMNEERRNEVINTLSVDHPEERDNVKQKINSLIRQELSYCSKCGSDDIETFDQGTIVREGFDFTMCCGFPIHQNCLQEIATSSQTSKLPGAQYACFNCGFAPTGLVVNRADAISSIRRQNNQEFDPIKESLAWSSRVAEASKNSAQPFFYNMTMYQDSINLIRGNPNMFKDFGSYREDRKFGRMGDIRYGENSSIQLPITTLHKKKIEAITNASNANEVVYADQEYQVILGNVIQGISPSLGAHNDDIISQYKLFTDSVKKTVEGDFTMDSLRGQLSLAALSEVIQIQDVQRKGFLDFVSFYLGDYMGFVTVPDFFQKNKDQMFYNLYDPGRKLFGNSMPNQIVSVAHSILANIGEPGIPHFPNNDPYGVYDKNNWENMTNPRKRQIMQEELKGDDRNPPMQDDDVEIIEDNEVEIIDMPVSHIPHVVNIAEKEASESQEFVNSTQEQPMSGEKQSVRKTKPLRKILSPAQVNRTSPSKPRVNFDRTIPSQKNSPDRMAAGVSQTQSQIDELTRNIENTQQTSLRNAYSITNEKMKEDIADAKRRSDLQKIRMTRQYLAGDRGDQEEEKKGDTNPPPRQEPPRRERSRSKDNKQQMGGRDAGGGRGGGGGDGGGTPPGTPPKQPPPDAGKFPSPDDRVKLREKIAQLNDIVNKMGETIKTKDNEIATQKLVEEGLKEQYRNVNNTSDQNFVQLGVKISELQKVQEERKVEQATYTEKLEELKIQLGDHENTYLQNQTEIKRLRTAVGKNNSVEKSEYDAKVKEIDRLTKLMKEEKDKLKKEVSEEVSRDLEKKYRDKAYADMKGKAKDEAMKDEQDLQLRITVLKEQERQVKASLDTAIADVAKNKKEKESDVQKLFESKWKEEKKKMEEEYKATYEIQFERKVLTSKHDYEVKIKKLDEEIKENGGYRQKYEQLKADKDTVSHMQKTIKLEEELLKQDIAIIKTKDAQKEGEFLRRAIEFENKEMEFVQKKQNILMKSIDQLTHAKKDVLPFINFQREVLRADLERSFPEAIKAFEKEIAVMRKKAEDYEVGFAQLESLDQNGFMNRFNDIRSAMGLSLKEQGTYKEYIEQTSKEQVRFDYDEMKKKRDEMEMRLRDAGANQIKLRESITRYDQSTDRFNQKALELNPLYQEARQYDNSLPENMMNSSQDDWNRVMYLVKSKEDQLERDQHYIKNQLAEFDRLQTKINQNTSFMGDYTRTVVGFVKNYEEYRHRLGDHAYNYDPVTIAMREGTTVAVPDMNQMHFFVGRVKADVEMESRRLLQKTQMLEIYRAESRKVVELENRIHNNQVAYDAIDSSINAEIRSIYGLLQNQNVPQEIMQAIPQNWVRLNTQDESSMQADASDRRVQMSNLLEVSARYLKGVQSMGETSKAALDQTTRYINQIREAREKVEYNQSISREVLARENIVLPEFQNAVEAAHDENQNLVPGTQGELDAALTKYRGMVQEQVGTMDQRNQDVARNEGMLLRKIEQLKSIVGELATNNGKIERNEITFRELVKGAIEQYNYKRELHGQALANIDDLLATESYDQSQELDFVKLATTEAYRACEESKTQVIALQDQLRRIQQSTGDNETKQKELDLLNREVSIQRQNQQLVDGAVQLAENYNNLLNNPDSIDPQQMAMLESEMERYGVMPPSKMQDMKRDLGNFVRNMQDRYSDERYDYIQNMVDGAMHIEFIKTIQKIYTQQSLITNPALKNQKSELISYLVALCKNHSYNLMNLATSYNVEERDIQNSAISIPDIRKLNEVNDQKYARSAENLDVINRTLPELERMMRSLHKIDRQMKVSRGSSVTASQYLDTQLGRPDSELNAILNDIQIDFEAIRKSRGNPYSVMQMGIGSERIKTVAGRLEDAVSQVQKIVMMAYKDKTDREIQDVTDMLASNLVTNMGRGIPRGLILDDENMFNQIQGVRNHMKELFIATFQIEQGKTLDKISDDFLHGVRGILSLNPNTEQEIQTNVRQFLSTFGGSFRQDVIKAMVNVVGKNCEPILKELNEKGFHAMMGGDVSEVLNSGVKYAAKYNDSYNRRLQASFQGSLKDHQTYLNEREAILSEIKAVQNQMILPDVDEVQQLGSDREYAKSVVDARKEKNTFGKAIHGMGSSVTGYQQKSLMDDLNKHIEMSSIKRTAEQLDTVEAKKGLQQKLEMMKQDVSIMREKVSNRQQIQIENATSREALIDFEKKLSLQYLPLLGSSESTRFKRGLKNSEILKDADQVALAGSILYHQEKLVASILTPIVNDLRSGEMISTKAITELEMLRSYINQSIGFIKVHAGEIQQANAGANMRGYTGQLELKFQERFGFEAASVFAQMLVDDQEYTKAKATMLYIGQKIEEIYAQNDAILDQNYELLDESLGMVQEQSDGLMRIQKMNEATNKIAEQVNNSIMGMMQKYGLAEVFESLKQAAGEAKDSVFPKILHNSGGGAVGGQFKQGGGGYAPGISPSYQSGMPGQSRPMMAYPNSAAVRGYAPGSQGGSDGNTPDGGNANRSRLSEKVFSAAGSLGSISSLDVKTLKRLRYSETEKKLKMVQEDGEERDLTEDEKKRVVKLLIKIIVFLYSKTMKDMSETERRDTERQLASKYSQNSDATGPGKLMGMLNKLADKYVKKDIDGDAVMR